MRRQMTTSENASRTSLLRRLASVRSAAEKKESKESPIGGCYVGPPHTVCTLCGNTLQAGWLRYDGAKYQPPAKPPATKASPSRRVTQPAKSKREIELEKKLASMEK